MSRSCWELCWEEVKRLKILQKRGESAEFLQKRGKEAISCAEKRWISRVSAEKSFFFLKTAKKAGICAEKEWKKWKFCWKGVKKLKYTKSKYLCQNIVFLPYCGTTTLQHEYGLKMKVTGNKFLHYKPVWYHFFAVFTFTKALPKRRHKRALQHKRWPMYTDALSNSQPPTLPLRNTAEIQ